MRELQNIKSKKKKERETTNPWELETKKVLNFRGGKRLVFNTYNTNYPVIDVAAKHLGFKTIYKDHNLVPSAELKAAHKLAPGLYSNIVPEEFDVVWFDLSISADVLSKIKPHQRVSQWPGIQVLSHKNRLAKNLNAMKRLYPKEYDIFPQTFLLPAELKEFKREFHGANGQPKPFIVKPCHDCQGRGIYLVNEFDALENPETPQVAQAYVDDPYLIDTLKFDLRLYVLLYGIHPLRIYLFDDGMARFATNPYQSAKEGDIKDLFTHLTNYSINKNSGKYVQNQTQDGGSGGSAGPDARPCHKRSLKQIYRQLEAHGKSVGRLQDQINDLIVKTIITGQSSLHHTFRTCQPDDLENQLCFQVLGFDVMFDQNLKPWLLEINQSPSFATDSAFDYALKRKLMEDTFKLLNLTPERKQIYNEQKEKQYFARMLRSSNKYVKPTFEEKEYKRFEIDKLRDAIEKPLIDTVGYDLIFPVKDDESKMRQYTQYLRAAREMDDQFTHGKKAGPQEENVYDIILKAQASIKGAPKKEPRPKTAAVPVLYSKPGAKNFIQEANLKVKQAMLTNIQAQKEEVKAKDGDKKAKLIQTVKRKLTESDKKLSLKQQVKDLSNAQVRFTQDQFDVANQRADGEVALEYPAINEFSSSLPISQKQFDPAAIVQSDLSNPYAKLFNNRLIAESVSTPDQTPLHTKVIQNDVRKAVPASPLQKKDKTPPPQSKKAFLTPLSELRKLKDLAVKEESERVQARILTPVLEKKAWANVDKRPSYFQTPSKAEHEEDVAARHKRLTVELEYRNKYLLFSSNQYVSNVAPIAPADNLAGPRRERSENRPTLQSINKLSTPAQAAPQRYVPFHKRPRTSTSAAPFGRGPAHSQSRAAVLSPRQKLLNDAEAGGDGGVRLGDVRRRAAPEGSPKKMARKDFEPAETIPEEDGKTQDFRDRMSMRARRHKAKLMDRQAQNYQSIDDSGAPTAEEPIAKPFATGAQQKEPKEEVKAIEVPQIQYVGLYDDVKKVEKRREEPKPKPKEKPIPLPVEERKQEEKPQVQYVGLYDNVEKVEKKREEVRVKEKPRHVPIPQEEPRREEKPVKVQYVDLYPHQDVVKVEKKRPPKKKKKGFSGLDQQGTVVDIEILQAELRFAEDDGPAQPIDYNEQNLILQNSMQQYTASTASPRFDIASTQDNDKPLRKSRQPRQPTSSLDIHRPMLPSASTVAHTQSLQAFAPESVTYDIHGSTADLLLRTPPKHDQSETLSPQKRSAQKSEKKKAATKKDQLNNKLAKIVFLQLIDDLKSQGKDPVFNLTSDFTTNCHIGHGTLSVIKKCTHNKTGYQVALKTYEKKMLVRKSQLMAIHREIYILAGLDHPNMMKLFEVIDTRTHVNLVTEFCHGCNLFEYVRAFGRKCKVGKNKVTSFRLDEPAAKKIFKQLAGAVSYMHDLGLVHRDLKIEHVLINEANRQVKLIDFASATSFQANDKLSMIGGAPQYKNPETIKAKTRNGQAQDAYALGIILYILLTGGAPQWAKVDSELYVAVIAEKYELPLLINKADTDPSGGQAAGSGFSEELEDLIREIFEADGKSGTSKMDLRDVMEHSWLQSGAD